ncbi:MAG: hypothetical protein MJE66_18505 [Proteobacteria bacterium]|nr:hypothetical protein [Pseudomonadota bacterium]
MSKFSGRLWATTTLVAVAFVLSCGQPPRIVIESPANGTFSNASSIAVTGRITGRLGTVADVTVNGVSVLPLGSGGAYSATVALDDSAIFNPIIVEMTRTTGQVTRDRVTVIAGESIVDGDVSPMGIALRLNDSGLDSVEPVIGDLVDFDLAAILPAGTVIADQCFIDTFLGCTGSAVVTIDNPPPSLTGFSIDIDSQTNQVSGDIDVNGIRVDVDINGSGLVPDCGLRLTASVVNLDGNYGLDPDGVDPSNIDVSQIGGIGVSFQGFNQNFTSGLCDVPIIGDIIQLIVGDVQPIVISGLQNFLDDPDGAGPADSVIADAIETALDGVEIAGPIGDSIGVNLEAPLFDVFEDVNGITLDSDARITASMPNPASPDLPASYHVVDPFPTFGPNTPVGGLPYGLALCISTSAFNQLLKAEVESGLLLASLFEIDLGGGLIPLTAGNLSFIPVFALLDPATPLRIDLIPTTGPVVTGNNGPGGEIAELKIGHLQALVIEEGGGQVLLELAVDATIGLDIGFTDGALEFSLGDLATEDLNITIVENTLGANEAGLINLLLFLLPDVLPTLADSLGTFPIPDFLGLQLDLVEVSKNGNFMSLFVNLTPAP